MLVHQCLGNIQDLIACQYGTQAIIGIITENEQLFVGKANGCNYLSSDEKPFKGGTDNLDGAVTSRLASLS